MTIKLLSLATALCFSLITTAQSFEPPALPTTKEVFIKSEPDIYATGKAINAGKEGRLKDWVKEKNN